MTRKGPEALIQAAVCEWLTLQSLWWTRMNSGAVLASHNGRTRMVRYGRPGMADLLATSRARIARPVWLEIKSAVGRQTAEQRAFELEVIEAGHEYLIIRSLDDLMAYQGWGGWLS